jgi:serine phosphatase RsbU (regulator of sigma subunit)
MTTDPPFLVAGGTSTPLLGPVGGGLSHDALALQLRWDATGRCCEARVADPADTLPDAGADAVPATADGWLDAVHSDDRQIAAGMVRSVLRDGQAREEALRLQDGDRWAVLRVHAVTAERALPGAPEGRLVGAAGVLVDATRSIGTTARRARLVEGFNSFRHADEIVRSMLDEGIALLNGRTAALYVLSEDDDLIVAGAAGVPYDMLQQRFGRIPRSSSLPAAEVLRTGEPVVVASMEERRARYPELDDLAISYDPAFVVVPLKDADGTPFGSLGVGFVDEQQLDDTDSGVLGYVAAQCALALDRARLASAAERDQDRLRFLDELSGTLSSTLELDAALSQLAGMTVPRIADWCVVRLVESSANPRPVVGAAHVDPDQVDRLRRLASRIPRDLSAWGGGLADALLAGRPLIRGARAAQMLRPLFDDGDSHEAMEAVGVEGLAVFPLRARGRLLGAVGFGNRPGRSFSNDELGLAQSVAQRAAVIVDNARLFDEQSVVARALQDSLLPGSLPDIPGIELGARYRAAGAGLDVGGDFYDAFQADENWWIVAVGDVCGHGVEAAATTGLVRHTIRTAAMAGVMPSAILARLNRMLLRHMAEWAADDDKLPETPRFCTVLVGAVQPTSRGVDLILCSGGHPLPLVHRTVGRVDPVGVPGTLLGVTDEVSLTDTVVHLDPGESLVCYTDGLVDRRSGRRVFGEEGIVKALYQGKALHADELARLIESEAVGFVDAEPTDDMAVLTLRAAPRR